MSWTLPLSLVGEKCIIKREFHRCVLLGVSLAVFRERVRVPTLLVGQVLQGVTWVRDPSCLPHTRLSATTWPLPATPAPVCHPHTLTASHVPSLPPTFPPCYPRTFPATHILPLPLPYSPSRLKLLPAAPLLLLPVVFILILLDTFSVPPAYLFLLQMLHVLPDACILSLPPPLSTYSLTSPHVLLAVHVLSHLLSILPQVPTYYLCFPHALASAYQQIT